MLCFSYQTSSFFLRRLEKYSDSTETTYTDGLCRAPDCFEK